MKTEERGIIIREFGLLQLCGQPVKAVQENLPWCAPEIIHASKRLQQSTDHLICTRESDVYSFGSYDLF